MKTIELFCGTKSFSKVMDAHGHDTLTVDIEPSFEPSLCEDVLELSPDTFATYQPDMLWASPPCTAFSVASIGHHWGGGIRAYIPKTESAKLGIALVRKTVGFINELKPRWWFIENPRGVLRNLGIITGGGTAHGLILPVW